MADEITGNDLVEEITAEVRDAEVISYAVDANLTVAGAAADAKAVGDRFAEDEAKTAEDILYAAGGETTIKDVLDDLADNTGEDIAVSSTDNTSIASKVSTIEASLYGTQIPVSSAAGAGSVADALTAQAAKTGNELLYSSGGSTIKTVVDGINSRLTTAESTLTDVSSAVSGMNAVKYTEQTLTAAQQAQARANIGAVAPSESVSVDAQTLTTSQKAQVRSNIGAISADDAVSVNSQSLTDTQKAQARTNIAALSAADVADVVRTSEQSLTVAQQTQARANLGIVADQVSTETVTLPSGLTATFTKVGKICTMYITGQVSSSVSQWGVIGTIPTAFLPYGDGLAANFADFDGYLLFHANGNINIGYSVSSGAYVITFITYIAA